MPTMIVGNIMKRNVITIEKDAPIEQAAALMKHDRVRSVVVINDDKVCGIVTDSDIVYRVLTEGRPTGDLKVANVMSANPVVIGPDNDIFEAVKLMEKNRFRRLPVVQDGKLVGIISVGDLSTNILVRLELLRSRVD